MTALYSLILNALRTPTATPALMQHPHERCACLLAGGDCANVFHPLTKM